jgi:hypothetical protein
MTEWLTCLKVAANERRTRPYYPRWHLNQNSQFLANPMPAS